MLEELYKALKENEDALRVERRLENQINLIAARLEILKSIVRLQKHELLMNQERKAA